MLSLPRAYNGGMAFLDAKGRVFGLVNVIDLLAAVLVVAAGAGIYSFYLRNAYMAEPFRHEGPREWIRVEVRLDPEDGWIGEHIEPGALQRNTRTGAPMAEIEDVQLQEGRVSVAVRLRAYVSGDRAPVYDRKPVVPGRRLEFETGSVAFEGRVVSIHGVESDAP